MFAEDVTVENILDTISCESEFDSSDQFNALDYLLGKPSSPQVVYESMSSSRLVPIQNNPAVMNHSQPEQPNNAGCLNCLDDGCLNCLFNGVINRPMEEVDQLLTEAGIIIRHPEDISGPDAEENDPKAAPSLDFDSLAPNNQQLNHQLPLSSPDDMILLQVEQNSNETKIYEEPCVPIEPDPHPDEPNREVKRSRRMATKSQPLQNITNANSLDIMDESEVTKDRRLRNNAYAKKYYTRIGRLFRNLKNQLKLSPARTQIDTLEKASTVLKDNENTIDILRQLVSSLKLEIRHFQEKLSLLQETKGMEFSKSFKIKPILPAHFFSLSGEKCIIVALFEYFRFHFKTLKEDNTSQLILILRFR